VSLRPHLWLHQIVKELYGTAHRAGAQVLLSGISQTVSLHSTA